MIKTTVVVILLGSAAGVVSRFVVDTFVAEPEWIMLECVKAPMCEGFGPPPNAVAPVAPDIKLPNPRPLKRPPQVKYT